MKTQVNQTNKSNLTDKQAVAITIAVIALFIIMGLFF